MSVIIYNLKTCLQLAYFIEMHISEIKIKFQVEDRNSKDLVKYLKTSQTCQVLIKSKTKFR